MTLAEPIGMEALEMDHGLDAAALEEARDDLGLEHPPELARHAGREEEARFADIQGEAARGADRVVDDFGARRQHRLLAVVGRHDAAAAVEILLHARQPLGVEHEVDSGRLRGDFVREIVDRRAEAAIDDDGAGALAGLAECGEQRLAVVADRRAPAHGKAEILELLADIAEITVDDLAGQHLVAGADDLDLHARIHCGGRQRARANAQGGAELSSLSTSGYAGARDVER